MPHLHKALSLGAINLQTVKSKTFFIIISLFLVQVAFGQEISKTDILKFKIKSISTIDEEGKIKFTEFYNDKGNFIKQGFLNKDQTLQINRELFYNDSLQLIEESTYTINGDINSTSKYYYNNKSQLVKKEAISYDKVDAIWIYEYDANSNKISETQKSGTMANSMIEYKYDANNLLIQEDKTNNTIGKEERINYKYSDKKQILEKKTKSYYFNTTLTHTYLYDDMGKLSKLIEKSSNGVSSTTVYVYNDKGLLISDTWQSSISKIPHKTSYRINFK